jgi:hypothetical protein
MSIDFNFFTCLKVLFYVKKVILPFLNFKLNILSCGKNSIFILGAGVLRDDLRLKIMDAGND